jgi:hypothetical protein
MSWKRMCCRIDIFEIVEEYEQLRILNVKLLRE